MCWFFVLEDALSRYVPVTGAAGRGLTAWLGAHLQQSWAAGPALVSGRPRRGICGAYVER